MEKRKTGFFRGVSTLNKVTWWWNLVFIGLSLLLFVNGSGFHGVLTLGFLVLWVVVELIRIGSNHLYDAETEALKAPVKKSEMRLW